MSTSAPPLTTRKRYPQLEQDLLTFFELHPGKVFLQDEPEFEKLCPIQSTRLNYLATLVQKGKIDRFSHETIRVGTKNKAVKVLRSFYCLAGSVAIEEQDKAVEAYRKSRGVISFTSSDTGLACPKCGCQELKVTESRGSTASVRRRRACVNPQCGARFTTYEIIDESDCLTGVGNNRKAMLQELRKFSEVKQLLQRIDYVISTNLGEQNDGNSANNSNDAANAARDDRDSESSI